MMNFKISKKHFLALAVAAAAGVMGSFGPAPASAAPTTHTLTSTGSNNWSTATWTNGAPSGIVQGDIASYSTSTTASNTTLNVTGIGLGQLDVTASGTWTISNGTGTSITLDNTGGNTNPFGDATKYAFIGTTSSGGIVVNPGVVIANTNLTVGGVLTGAVTLNGGITGTGNLFVADASTAIITIQTNAINNTGTLTFGNSDATTIKAGTGTITVSGGIGTSVGNIVDNAKGNLTLSGSSIANTGSITFSGVGTSTVTFSSTTINNAGSITNNGATTGGTTISGGLGGLVTGVTENSGTSALTLSGNNTNFDGTTTLTAGTLNLNSATALGGNGSSSGTGGTFTIAGGTLNTVAGGIAISTVNAENWNGSFTFTGTGNLNLGTGAVTLGTTSTVTVSADTLTVNGAIGGSTFGITKAGVGTMVLGALNTYTGTTTINAGVLTSAVSASSGTPLGTGAVMISGTLNLLPTGSGSDVTFTGGTVASGTLFTFTGNNNTLILAKGAENSLTYTFGGGGAAIARGTNGTLVITESAAGTLGSTSGERFILNGTAPAVNSTNANLVNLPIVVQTSPSDSTGDFLTYGGNGFISSSTQAAYTVPTSTAQATATGAIWDVTGNSTVGANSTAAALGAVRVASGKTLTVAPNATLSVGSTGNLAQFILNGGTITGGLNSTLALGAAEGTIYVSSAGGTISTSVSGTGQLTIFGPGTLTIANNNTTTAINIANNIVNNASGMTFSGNGTINLNFGNLSSGLYGFSTAGITINSGTTVVNFNQANNSNPFGTNAPTITDNGNLTFAESGNPTIVQQLQSRIIGTGSITMNTGSTFVMKVANSGGADSFSGGLNIISGTWHSTYYATAFGTGVVSLLGPNAVLDVSYGNGNANFGVTTGGLAGTGTLGSVTAVATNTGFSTLTLTDLAATNSYSFGGAITNGAGGIAITLTSGTQIFTGASSYTKGTTVSGGTLVATGSTSIGSATGALTVTGGTFNYDPTAATPTALTVATLALTSGGKIGAGIGDTTTDGAIVVTGAASGTGAALGTTKINIEGDPFIASAPNGTYTLVTAASGLLNGSNYTLGTVYNATNFTVTGAPTGVGGTSITVGIASQTALTTEYWKGGFVGGAGVWAASDGSTASNWTSDAGGATPTSLTPGSAATVVFSATGASGQSTMTLGANMTVAGIIVNDTAAQTLTDGYTLTVGTGGITLNGGAGAVTYNVPVALNGGQTWLNNSGSTLTVSGPIYNGANTLTIDGSGNTVISGNLGVGAASTPGTGGLTMVGAGTLTLLGANSYTGATAVQNGTLVLGTVSGSTTTLGSIASSSGVTLGNGTTSGILQIGDANNANNATLLSLVTAGTGTANAVVGGNAANSTLTLNVASGTDTYAGVLGGAGANQNNLTLTKTGAGTVALTGVNTYLGGTVISGGTLNVTGSGTLGATTGTLALTAASTILDLGTTSQTVGAVSLTAATGTATIRNGNLTAASVASSNASGTDTISAALQGGGTVTTLGAGTLLLSGANTYTGATTVNAGTLFAGIASVANTSGAFGNNSAVTMANAAGATLNITGFNTQIGSLTGGGAAGGNVTLGAATLTTGGDNTSPAAYAGIISGTGGLAKIGTGTAILTGANTYSGATSINTGTLTLNRTSGSVLANSAVTVGSATTNGTLQITGNNTIGTAAGGSLTLSGGDGVTTGQGTLSLVDGGINTLTLTNRTTAGTNFTVGSTSGPAILNFEVGASAGVSDSVALGNDTLALASGGGIINITPLSTLAIGSYNLITYASKTGTGGFTFDGTNTTESVGGFTLSLSSGLTAEVLSITQTSAGAAYFQGATDANWSTNNAGVVNFTSDAAGATNLGALPGSQTNVHFSASNATQTGGVVVSNLDASFSINSLKFDTGTAGAAINAGGGTLTINAGNFNGSNAGDGITVAAGAGPVTIAAPIILGGSQTWTNNSSNQFVVTGSISGANTLATVGSIQLGGINTYTGGTTVTSGTLQMNANSASAGNGGLGSVNNALAVNGTLDLNATSQQVGTLSGTGTILNSAGSTVSSLTIGNNNATGTSFDGVLEDNAGSGGTLSLIKVGTGTQTLTGANTYTGGTTLSAGGLIGTTTSLQGNIAASNSTTLTFNQAGVGTFNGLFTGGNTAALIVTGGGTVTLSGNDSYTGGTTVSGGSTVSIGTLADSGTSNLGNSGTLSLNGGTLLYTGSSTSTARTVSITQATGGTIDVQNSGAVLDLTGNVTGTAANSTLTVNGAGTVELANATNNTNLANASVTNGTLLLNATNTSASIHAIYGGTITVGADGTLQFGLGSTNEIGFNGGGEAATNITLTGNGVVDMNGSNQTFNTLSSTSSSALVTNSAASTLSILNFGRNGGAGGTFAGVIQNGNGTVGLSVNNNATLSGPNTYTGSTTVVFGELTAGTDSTLTSGPFGVNSALVLGTGSANAGKGVNVNGHNVSVGSLASVGTNVGAVELNGGTLTIGGDNTNTTYIGSITGSVVASTPTAGPGNIVKVGTGTLALSGASNYTGTTTVSNGTLLIQSTNTSSTITLNGGVLGGYGTMSGAVTPGSGSYTIAPSATLTPTSTGTMTVGGLTTGSGTTLQFNLVTPGNTLNSTMSNSDTIVVTGSGGLVLNGGTVNLTNHSTGAASLGFYKVMSINGGIGGTGLSSLTLPATANNVDYTFDTTHDPGFVDIHRGFLGDVDDSGFVDINDLATLAAHWQQPGGWAQGNFLGDAVVDINDLSVLAAHWQTGITSFGEAADSLGGTSESFQQAVSSIVFGGASSVPEPASLALLGLGAAGLILRRRRTR